MECLRKYITPALDGVERSLAILKASQKQIPPGVFHIIQQNLENSQKLLHSEINDRVIGVYEK